MKFDQHIRIVINKGKRIAGWILRVFKTRTPTVMLTLLKQLIYPTVEYNSILWNPKEQELIDSLEAIQNSFLKQIYSPNLTGSSDYWDRLEHFKLYSLQRRRERYQIMYVWKVLHNLYPNPGIHMNMTTRDHLAHPNKGIAINSHPRLGMTAHHQVSETLPQWLKDKSVLKSCCDLFNVISPHLRQPAKDDEEPSFDKFKEALDAWLVTIPDRPKSARRPNPTNTNSILEQIQYIARR